MKLLFEIWNKFAKAIYDFLTTDLPIILNRYRLFPRAFFGAYIYVFVTMCLWFMGLEEPTTQQASFVSVIVGVGAGWFGIYTATGNSTQQKMEKLTVDGTNVKTEIKTEEK